MGRFSVKENKSIYQKAREELKLTRAKASELLGCITDTRLEKIESGKILARPEEVLTMEQKYKAAGLCNYYCASECPIGQKYVRKLELKDLSQITIEMLANLNALDRDKERLVEIAVDGIVSDEERADFEKIRKQLSEMSDAIDSLSLWVDNAINTGKIV